MSQHPQAPHAWQFFRAGGVDQVVIRSGADIAHLGELDQKLWVALACPTRGIEFDARSLDLIDADKDGRIRPPELLDACRWAVSHVKDPEVLARGGDLLRLGDLDLAHDDGPAMLAEARRILSLAGRPDADALSLADVEQRQASLNAMPFNGDGVLSAPALADQPEAAALLQAVIAHYGSVDGADGLPGADRARIETFFADAEALRDWQAQLGSFSCALQPHERALAAAEALMAVQTKVEDFFARASVAQFDARAAAALSPSVEGYVELGKQMLAVEGAAIEALPLAPVVAGADLPLGAGVNPAWAARIETFRRAAVAPLLGEALEQLSLGQWRALQAQLQPCQDWLAARPGSPLNGLDQAALQALLAPAARAALLEALGRDEAEREHMSHTAMLEKLIRLQRDLLKLLNNFVSFSSFYRREGAAFQAGTLYLDGRSCDLTVEVADAGAHAALAGMAKTFLAYCDCQRDGVKKTIVAAFMAGDVDFLFVGRNGVFYDREGRDWDARISKLIENPTSIGQAFASPYKKFLRLIEEQVAKRAAAKEGEVNLGLDQRAQHLTAPGALAAAAPVAPAARKTDVGTVAAIGVALGSISAVMVGIFSKFVELGPWIPVALVGVVLAISGPSMMIAWLKLRQRSLGPILDASGWAINGRMRINLRLGRSLSQTAKTPSGALGTLSDPFADRQWGRWAVLGGVLLAAAALYGGWRLQLLDGLRPAPAVSAPALAP